MNWAEPDVTLTHFSLCSACCRDTLWESSCDGYSKSWSRDCYILGQDRIPAEQLAFGSYSLGQPHWGKLYFWKF